MILTFCLVVSSIFSYSQETHFKDVSASQIVDVLIKLDFKLKITIIKILSTGILQLSDYVIKQLNISGWYLCNNRQEYVFRNYNLYYKPISRSIFDLYCKESTALMICDRTYKQPR